MSKMVDFVKIAIPEEHIPKLERNTTLDFILQVNESTGEEANKKIAHYKGLKFIIYKSGYCELQGSLHKYYNNGEHNYNDFCLKNLFNVLDELNTIFKIDFQFLTILNIEFGVNITPPIKTSHVLNNCLLSGYAKIKDVSLKGSNCNYKQVTKQRIYLKLYDKRKHYCKSYDIKSDIMRYEIKFKKMIEANALGFYCLNDLEDPKVVLAIKIKLIKYWKSIILYDPSINKSKLSYQVRNVKLNQWSNSNFWLNLNSKKRYNQRKQYDKIVSQYSDGIHQKTESLIKIKWDFLTNN